MDGRGIDYRAIGTQMGLSEAIGIMGRAVHDWRARAERAERRLRLAEAEMRAMDAGRLAQVHALKRALEIHAPLDPILKGTGRFYAGGDPERAFEAGYAGAYDDVARGTGLDPCVRPMTPSERAEAIEAEVVAEPVVVKGWWLWERVLWRGVQHRTIDGAKRARARAAVLAKEAAMDS